MANLLQEYQGVLQSTRNLKKKLEEGKFDVLNKELVELFKEVSRLQEIPLTADDDRDAVAEVIKEIVALDEEYTKLILAEQNRIMEKFRAIRTARQQEEYRQAAKPGTTAPRFFDKKT